MASDNSASWEVSIIQFDPDGDVILVVPSEAQKRVVRFQVNSQSLCLASSVFRAMLGTNASFKDGDTFRNKGTSSPPIKITLEDDEPKALAVLLRIVHHQYDWIPRTLNDNQLYQVAIVCDKYDMRDVLGLWLDQWIPLDTQCGGRIVGDQWLYIAHTLGREALFTQLSRDLILTSTMDANGSLIARSTGSFNHYIPSPVLAEISARRQQALKGMLECIYQKIETYRDAPAVLCAHQSKNVLCDTFFLGFLLKTLTRLKVDSLNISEHDNYPTSLSIQELKNVLDGLITPEHITLHEKSPICTCSSSGYSRDNCGKHGANHASACSPIPKLKDQIGEMFTKVQGLEWSQFVRNSSTSGATTGPKNQDLWDYLG